MISWEPPPPYSIFACIIYAIQDDSDSDRENIPLFGYGSKRDLNKRRNAIPKIVRRRWDDDSNSDQENIPFIGYGSKRDLDNRSNAIPKTAPRDTDDDRISDNDGDGDCEATDNSDNEKNVSDDDNDDDDGSNGYSTFSDDKTKLIPNYNAVCVK